MPDAMEPVPPPRLVVFVAFARLVAFVELVSAVAFVAFVAS